MRLRLVPRRGPKSSGSSPCCHDHNRMHHGTFLHLLARGAELCACRDDSSPWPRNMRCLCIHTLSCCLVELSFGL